MLLWITEYAALYYEPENMIIRTPQVISNIEPNSVSIVLIDSLLPTSELLQWGGNRSLPTLWWQPKVSIPAIHCAVNSYDYDCKNFAFLLGRLLLRNDILNLHCGEIESAILKYSQMVIVPYKKLSAERTHLQKYSLGYFIQKGIKLSLEDFQQKFEWTRRVTAVNELYSLLLAEEGSEILWAFR
ncbi:hypothetical protein BTO00_10705 [Vibrio campbellii]|uniref:hypothetical protein n=1 Tax=Vibrio campbellii TaxID=680 RepID=UPI000CF4A565|nr:hypothetical protein [Vibrio campbellii]PQJ42533.1 hypothetical protein BTO00_10705 [Vibrio campbellii]